MDKRGASSDIGGGERGRTVSERGERCQEHVKKFVLAKEEKGLGDGDWHECSQFFSFSVFPPHLVAAMPRCIAIP
jgi:hypothetical protein